MLRLLVCVMVAVMGVVLAGGCERAPASEGSTGAGRKVPYQVVTTVAMVTDVVRQVAGDRAEVTGIIGTGVDPHLYKASRDDVVRLSGAQVVFYVGLHLEGKMGDVLGELGKRVPGGVHAVGELIGNEKLLAVAGEGEGASGHDPHLWMDAAIWSAVVEVVAEKLSAYDPDGVEGYRQRAASLRAELAGLDEYGRRVIGSIPEGRRVLITSHDAFRYFGRAYGLEVRGIQGISTESEAGLRDINGLIDLIVGRGVSAVFVESSVPRKNVEALIEGSRSRGHELKIGGELYSDAMGSQGTYEGTYVGMLDHNLTTVARALGGEAPEGGFKGRLSEGGR